MSVMRTLAVRARIEARPEPRFERLYDPLVDDLAHDGPIARQRFATRWCDEAALKKLAEAKRAPLPAALAAELIDLHRRLGAGPRSLAALERLARGEAVCAVSGQQPAPLGGPLYSLHKIATTVGLAAAFEERTGTPCVPLFWMHGEDSDFEEIRHATVADGALALHELELPSGIHREGRLVGSLPVAPLATLENEALRLLEGLPAARETVALANRARERARDLGQAMSALVLALFAEQGIVVAEPRLPAFRTAARPFIDRYVGRADELADAARRAGAWLEPRIGRQPLAGPALDSFVFAIEDGTRRKVLPRDARRLPPTVPLVPSVALRAAVQDGVFPTVAMACGPGEIAYLAQLKEVFEGVGVRAAAPVPRLSATWMPPAGVALLEAAGADAWDLVSGADAVLRRLAERQVPAEVREALTRARATTAEALGQFASAATQVDGSLPQMVDSARAKMDYQFARLDEGLAGKVRHRLERQHPEWMRVRYVLLPGDKLQERRLASLEVPAWRGAGVAAELSELALGHARRIGGRTLEHLVIDL
jgi:uncharacterized protein YllA (UPF0747 family)